MDNLAVEHNITPDRPKMTVENLIKKLKRDTLKLKEKLIQTTNYFKYK